MFVDVVGFAVEFYFVETVIAPLVFVAEISETEVRSVRKLAYQD